MAPRATRSSPQTGMSCAVTTARICSAYFTALLYQRLARMIARANILEPRHQVLTAQFAVSRQPDAINASLSRRSRAVISL